MVQRQSYDCAHQMGWGHQKANGGAKRQTGFLMTYDIWSKVIALGTKRQMRCQKANGVPKGKWGVKRQMGCQKANGVPNGKWGAKRQMGRQKANGAPKGK